MVITVVAILAGVLVLVGLFKPFFGGTDGFLECLRFWFTPDVVSLFRGEWGEDQWAEMKIGFWLFLGVISGLAVYTGLERLF